MLKLNPRKNSAVANVPCRSDQRGLCAERARDVEEFLGRELDAKVGHAGDSRAGRLDTSKRSARGCTNGRAKRSAGPP